MASELKILQCPMCKQERWVVGRGVRMKVKGVLRQVCDDCSLESTKKRVAKRAKRVRKIIQDWASVVDLSEAERLIGDAEFYLADAVAKLPDDFLQAPGNNRMARGKADAALRIAQETLIKELGRLTKDKLTQVGHVVSKKPDEAARAKAQERLDRIEAEIRDGIEVAAQYLELSEDGDLAPDDRRTILGDGVTAAIQAYMRCASYAEEKTEIDQAELQRRLVSAAVVESEAEELAEEGPAPEVDPGAEVEEDAAGEEVEE